MFQAQEASVSKDSGQGIALIELCDSSIAGGKSDRRPGRMALGEMFQRGQLNNQCSMFHFWSLRPGAANFLFADGHARPLRYSAAAVLPVLATRSGGEAAALPD